MQAKLILLTLVSAGVALMAGCATDRLGSKMATWQGSHVDSVVAQWGPADSCEPAYGQTVCTWVDGAVMLGNNATSFPVASISRPRCSRMLALNEAGYVTGWKWRGDFCDVSGQHVMAKNETPRPSAVADQFQLADEPVTKTARK